MYFRVLVLNKFSSVAYAVYLSSDSTLSPLIKAANGLVLLLIHALRKQQRGLRGRTLAIENVDVQRHQPRAGESFPHHICVICRLLPCKVRFVLVLLTLVRARRSLCRRAALSRVIADEITRCGNQKLHALDT